MFYLLPQVGSTEKKKKECWLVCGNDVHTQEEQSFVLFPLWSFSLHVPSIPVLSGTQTHI